MDKIKITITKSNLEDALRQWEQDARDGKCRGTEETAALSVDQVAKESADHLWSVLHSQ